jgi:hypothetical protein
MSEPSMGKRPRRGGEENEALSRRAKNFHSWRPGQRKAIKARANRRERRLSEKWTALDQADDWDWKPDVRPDRQHICSSCWDAADKTACPECDTLYLIGTCPECGGGQ